MLLITTIVHLSDLHFGTVDPRVRDGLTRDIHRQQASVLVISGDVTQRATESQFSEYHEYIRQFTVPKVVVPGNHDIPLYNVFARFFWPPDRFRKFAEPNPFPEYEDQNTYILGVNTAHSWTISGGRLTDKTIDEAKRRFLKVPESKVSILVGHHPMTAGSDVKEGWVGRLERMGEKIDVVLSGHLHLSSSEVLTKPGMLLVRAGTAISRRERGEQNSFNVIRIKPSEIEVEVRTWNDSRGEFESAARNVFPRG